MAGDAGVPKGAGVFSRRIVPGFRRIAGTSKGADHASLGQSHVTVRSITKTVRIACDPRTAFDFVADLGSWPRWAVVNVRSTRRSDDSGWWEMATPRGEARIRMRADARHGILDHDFVDPQASWTVPARVIANGGGAEFMITFFRPPGFTDDDCDEQIKLVDRELARLKEPLEAAA